MRQPDQQITCRQCSQHSFTELHRLRVLHHDGKPRNILYDSGSGQVMIVDFERAELCSRKPLGSISPNGQNRERKRKGALKQEKGSFVQGLQSVVECVSRCF